MRSYKIIKIAQDGKDYYGIFETLVDGGNVSSLWSHPINNLYFESLEELHEYMDDLYNQISNYKGNEGDILSEDQVTFLQWEDDHECDDDCDREDEGEWTSYHDHDHNHEDHHDKSNCCGGKWWKDCKCGF